MYTHQHTCGEYTEARLTKAGTCIKVYCLVPESMRLAMTQSFPLPTARRSGTVASGRREARLRPEHAARYPGIEAGVWEPAAVLCDRVIAGGLLRGSPGWRDRVLPPEHFEFRGEGPQGQRPRREDR